MKLGAVCLFDRNKITIPDYISIPLGLRRNTKLTVGFLNNEELIITPTPKKYWSDIFEFSIPLTHTPGASSSAAKALSDIGANILISESTTMGLISMGFWTGVVNFNTVQDRSVIQNIFIRQLSKQHKKTPFFPNNISSSNIKKQIFLRRLESLSICDNKLTTNNTSDKSFFDGSSVKIPDNFIERIAQSQGSESSLKKQYVFLAADLQERILTFTFPQCQRKLYHIHLVIKWTLKEEPYGIYYLVTNFLSNRGFNILRAYDYIQEKTETNEDSIMRFIVEGPYLTKDELSDIESELMKLGKKFDQNDKEQIFFFIANRDVDSIDNQFNKPNNPLILIPADLQQPKCFLARLTSMAQTPAVNDFRKKMEDLEFDIVEFNPSPKDQAIVFTSILKSIKQCCCLVNIILPHENYIYIDSSKNIPCPSPWLVAEDALALALGLRVFDVIDKSIEEKTLTITRGMDSISGWNLSEENERKHACDELEKKIRLWKADSNFYIAHGEAVRRAKEISSV